MDERRVGLFTRPLGRRNLNIRLENRKKNMIAQSLGKQLLRKLAN